MYKALASSPGLRGEGKGRPGDEAEEVGIVVRSRGRSACCARRVYWNVNYFGVIRAIAMARAVVGHRERAVPVACWP